MIKRMVTSALAAGLGAGLLAALLHFAFLQQDILLAERYETGDLVHFQGVHTVEAGVGHDHAAPAAAADDPAALQRNGLTVLFELVRLVAFGLILTAGFAVAESRGKVITAREGLLWGIAGYAAVQVAPALGLPPELPGIAASDIDARQVWWWSTVLATSAGLALLAYGQGIAAVALAVALIAAPHVIGAPELAEFSGVTPPELAFRFAARVLGTALPVWALLGWLSGRLWSSASA